MTVSDEIQAAGADRADLIRIPGRSERSNMLAFMEFLRRFELTDPEPRLSIKEPDRFTHKIANGMQVGAGWHYATKQVDDHIHWLTRRDAAYRAWLDQ